MASDDLEDLARRMAEADLPPPLQGLIDEQDRVIAALEALDLFEIDDVVGLGFGEIFCDDPLAGGSRTGAIVYVRPDCDDDLRARIPDTVVAEGVPYVVDVQVMGDVCDAAGNPAVQRQQYAPIPPDVGFSAIFDIGVGPPIHFGDYTGGLIVEPRNAASPPPQFLLTANHNFFPGGFPDPLITGHPWGSVRAVGGHVASGTAYDAAIGEIDNPTPTLVTAGPVGRARQAIVGEVVQKSGGTTGLTRGRVISVANMTLQGRPVGRRVLILNIDLVPGQAGRFLSQGDSGSASISIPPFGPLGGFAPRLAAALRQLGPLTRRLALFILTGSAVALNVATANLRPEPVGIALGPPAPVAVAESMPEVLAELGVRPAL